MDDATAQPSSPHLLQFLQAFAASQLHFSKPQANDQLHVIWSQTQSQPPTSGDPGLDSEWHIHEKVKEVLRELQWCSSKVLIQFWTLQSTEGEHKLSCQNQPFAHPLDSRCWSLRLNSSTYQYRFGGTTGTMLDLPFIASQNGLAGFCMDLRAHTQCRMVALAVEKGFMNYFAVPIFLNNACVGVVDCYAPNFDDMLSVSISLNHALEKHGLEAPKGQKYLPHEIVGGLKSTMDDITVAVRKICESHDLSFAQVSLAYQDNSPASSSMSVQAEVKKIVALALMVPCFDEDAETYDANCKLGFVNHAAIWDVLPIKIAKGLVDKALRNHKPYFCSDIFVIPDVADPPTTSGIKRLSCLTVCFRSESTGFNDLVFEFFWSAFRNSFTIIESIISRLKKRLPSLKFSCGAELSEPISVIEVGLSSESDFPIFEGGKLAGVAQLSGDTDNITQKDIEAQFQHTQKDAAKNLDVTVGS